MSVEAVCARHPRRVEQGVGREHGLALGRALNPEARETRELLALPADGVHRQPPCRQAVLLALADGAEIAGPQEGNHLVLVVGPVQHVVRTPSGKPDVTPFAGRQPVATEVEQISLVHNGQHLAGRDLLDADCRLVIAAEVEEHQLERQALAAPVGLRGPEADVPGLVVIELTQGGGQGGRFRLFIGPAGSRLGEGRHVVEAPDRGACLRLGGRLDECGQGPHGAPQRRAESRKT